VHWAFDQSVTDWHDRKQERLRDPHCRRRLLRLPVAFVLRKSPAMVCGQNMTMARGLTANATQRSRQLLIMAFDVLAYYAAAL
jgi:hypothetical protein